MQITMGFWHVFKYRQGMESDFGPRMSCSLKVAIATCIVSSLGRLAINQGGKGCIELREPACSVKWEELSTMPYTLLLMNIGESGEAASCSA